jgi:2-(1,2-epoxy-1,2-dihydrophenyl)acetyl-CoA isomerase
LSDKNVTYEVRKSVAWITIDRPEHLNAIDVATAKELFFATNECSSDVNVRCVVLTGAGDRAFSAGGDVPAFAAAGDRVDVLLKEMTTYLHGAISRLARLRAPVIAAVNGTAAGAGLGLVAAADLAIAVESAVFTSAYTKIGLTPDGSSTYFLSRTIGRRRTTELFLSNRVLSAQEALDWGLVNRVVPSADLKVEVESLASELSSGPTMAYEGVKRLVLSAFDETLETQMEYEARSIAAMSLTMDGRDGISAFARRGKPRFVGR